MAELAAQPTSVQSVYTWFREEKLFVNRRYQRKLVWTLTEKQKLIESIIRKYPIPAILLAEKETPGSYEIIDGLQRLHAIVSFIETAFETAEESYFDLSLFPTALGHSQAGLFKATEDAKLLGQKDVSTILDYSLSLSIMRNATEAEINDVFGRINTYGHRLSDQERRQAGVRNDFSTMVRRIACDLRGDVSDDTLLLSKMPSISIDLPKTKHGYDVQADEVFWVKQGVLRSTDLRDSMDEQYISDIAACIVSGNIIERSKDSLDAIYAQGSEEAKRVVNGLDVYGVDKFSDEFRFCIQEILNVCDDGKPERLRTILFKNRTTNAFPSVFAVLFLAFYELLIKENKIISSYSEVKAKINDLTSRIKTGNSATSSEERRKNIDVVKGIINASFIPRKDDKSSIYANHTTIDIDSMMRRSEVELANYELKQGLLSLDNTREIDPNMIAKVAKTICAIANNGPGHTGKIIIGVADKLSDAERIKSLDGVDPVKVGNRFVVGISREAKILGKKIEDYYSLWKEGLNSAPISEPLKSLVASSMDFNNFYGLGVIIITIRPQSDLSYYGDDVYWRNADSTEQATNMKQAGEISKRFKNT